MRRLFLILTCLLLAGSATMTAAEKPKKSCKVVLAGDSTCAKRKDSDRPKWGWGEKLENYLKGYKVVNRATGGRSTKSYIDEGRWDKLLEQVAKGDVVLIQFGHNDQKKKNADRYTEPYGAYYDNLCRMIADVKAKDAVPVILTSVTRRNFKDGTPRRTHGEYPAAAKKAAADCGVVALDIEELSFQWLTNLGEEKSALRYMVSVDGKDNTHFVELGANEVAEMIAKALKKCGDPYLKAFVK